MFDLSSAHRRLVVAVGCFALPLLWASGAAAADRSGVAKACLDARGKPGALLKARQLVKQASDEVQREKARASADIPMLEKAAKETGEKADAAKKVAAAKKAAALAAPTTALTKAQAEAEQAQQEAERAADAARTAFDQASSAAAQPSIDESCETLVNNVCAEAAQGRLDDETFLATNAKACVRAQFSGKTAAPAAAVGAEIVRSVAQVVVTKAQAAGWQLLIEKLKNTAQCDDTGTKFAATCKVLVSLNIKDLVSSPEVLTTAVITDLLNDLKSPVFNGAGALASNIAGLALADGAVGWAQSHDRGLADAMHRAILSYISDNASGACPTATIPEQYAYVVGMCVLQSPEKLSKCDAAALIRQCAPSDADVAAELGRLWSLTTTALVEKPQPIDIVNLIFALGRDQLDVEEKKHVNEVDWKKTADAYFDGAKDLASGLAEKDWVMATSGGVRILATLQVTLEKNAKTCDPMPEEVAQALACKDAAAYRSGIQLVRTLAAIGNYALTFDKNANSDPAAAAAAREKIITEMVDRMVSRSDRDPGVVFSLGGTLGIDLGARFGKQDKEIKKDFAPPVQLTLGIAVQTYHGGTGGFHLMFSAIDLGQYVSMNDAGDLKVASPDLKAALAPGVAIGGWFALRETPLHVAAHASYAPYNRADGNPTFQAGVSCGIYVPLLDFN